jgi:hypothetical protein
MGGGVGGLFGLGSPDISGGLGNIGGLSGDLQSLFNPMMSLAGQEASLAGPVTGLAQNTSTLSPPVASLAANTASLSPALAGYGNQTLGSAESQYQMGAAGQLTPGWQALVNNQLGQANTATTSAYGNLGLGDSTMVGQDKGQNALNALAETGNLAGLEEQLGLQGLSTGTSMVGEAGNLNAQAGGLYNTAAGINTQAAGQYGQAGNLLTGSGNLITGAGNMLTGAAGLQQGIINDQLTQASQGKSSLSSALRGAGNIGSSLGFA